MPSAGLSLSVSSPSQIPALFATFVESATSACPHECWCTTLASPLAKRMFVNAGGFVSSSKRASGPSHIEIHFVPEGASSMPNGNVEEENVVSASQAGSVHVVPARKLRHTPLRRRETPSPKYSAYTEPFDTIVFRQSLPTGPGGVRAVNPVPVCSSICCWAHANVVPPGSHPTSTPPSNASPTSVAGEPGTRFHTPFAARRNVPAGSVAEFTTVARMKPKSSRRRRTCGFGGASLPQRPWPGNHRKLVRMFCAGLLGFAPLATVNTLWPSHASPLTLSFTGASVSRSVGRPLLTSVQLEIR